MLLRPYFKLQGVFSWKCICHHVLLGCVIGFLSQNQDGEYTGQVNLINFDICQTEEEPLVFVCLSEFAWFSPRQILSEILSFGSEDSELIVTLPLHRQLFFSFQMQEADLLLLSTSKLKEWDHKLRNGIMNRKSGNSDAEEVCTEIECFYFRV